MYLPSNEQLNISALSRSFDDMSESYKIFWFNGILAEVKKGKRQISFNRIIINMITSAWYMVSEFHLNLGPSDTLEKLVLRAQNFSGLKSSSKKEDIEQFLVETKDDEIKKYISVLTLNVPYRLQAPFITDFKGDTWKSHKNVIERVNSDEGVMYHFLGGSGLNTQIVIAEKWFDYLFVNQAIIEGWIEYNLILYLQRRNPSVPGIASKLTPPSERKLEAAKKLWKGIIEFTNVKNIYDRNNTLLTKDDVSIDHFVPWSYVAHDELWNLVPTTKSINSSKSNNLPNWEIYFPKFSKVEYLAYQAIWSNSQINALFKKCSREHLNNDDIAFNLYRKGLDEMAFSKELEKTILPAYTAARNIGFSEWIV